MPVLSVVVPAYNEEENIVGAIDDILAGVAAAVPDLEIIIVDDGSRDRTAELVRGYAARDPRIVLLSQKNQGHGPAVSNGLRQARGDWLLLLDSDRQVALDGFAAHWAAAGDHDAILGLRRPRHDPAHRLAVSFVMRLLLLVLLGVNLRDAGAPYKLVRSGVWREARGLMRDGTWIPSVLLAARAMQRADLKVAQVPVVHQARLAGPTTLNLRRLARFGREGVADILHFARQARRATNRPR